LKIAQILLNTLLNYPVSNSLQLPQDAYNTNAVSVTYNRLFEYLNNPNRVGFIEEMFAEYAAQNNPEITSSRQRLDLQEILLKRNKARYLPSLDLIATLKYADEQNDTPPPFKEERSSWTIGGYVKFPLFLGFDRSRENRKLKADYSRFEYQRDNKINNIKAQVQTALTGVVTNIDKLSINVRRSDRTKYNLNLILDGYDAGSFDIKYLVGEIDEITSSEMEEIATRFSLYEAMADLAFEIGWTAYGSGTTFTQQIEKMIFEY
jgi:outer membrane protein TolC